MTQGHITQVVVVLLHAVLPVVAGRGAEAGPQVGVQGQHEAHHGGLCRVLDGVHPAQLAIVRDAVLPVHREGAPHHGVVQQRVVGVAAQPEPVVEHLLDAAFHSEGVLGGQVRVRHDHRAGLTVEHLADVVDVRRSEPGAQVQTELPAFPGTPGDPQVPREGAVVQAGAGGRVREQRGVEGRFQRRPVEARTGRERGAFVQVVHHAGIGRHGAPGGTVRIARVEDLHRTALLVHANTFGPHVIGHDLGPVQQLGARAQVLLQVQVGPDAGDVLGLVAQAAAPEPAVVPAFGVVLEGQREPHRGPRPAFRFMVKLQAGHEPLLRPVVPFRRARRTVAQFDQAVVARHVTGGAVVHVGAHLQPVVGPPGQLAHELHVVVAAAHLQFGIGVHHLAVHAVDGLHVPRPQVVVRPVAPHAQVIETVEGSAA